MGKLALDASTISEDVAYVVSTEKARDHRQDEGGQEIAPVEPYAPEVIVEPVVPVAPPVVGYAPPVPVAPEAEFDYGPPAGPALEVGGY